MVTRVKGEDWRATTSATLYSLPATTSAIITSAVPAGTILRSLAEERGADGGSWRMTEWPVGSATARPAWFRYTDSAGRIGAFVPLTQGGDATVDGALTDYVARKYPSIVTPPPVEPPTTTPPPTTEPPSPGVTYLFQDEFTSGLTKWRVSNYGVTGSGRGCCGTNHANYADQVVIVDGILHVKATKVGSSWHTGCLDTETKWLATPGTRWEARMQLPRGLGLWPAFWGYDKSGQEIDVIEACCGPDGSRGGNDLTKLHQSIHYDNTSPRIVRDTEHPGMTTGFHVYGVDWRAGAVQFTFDGEPQGAPVTEHVPTVGMPLILNLGIGGGWCGEPDAATPTVAEMLVDYVRVSKL